MAENGRTSSSLLHTAAAWSGSKSGGSHVCQLMLTRLKRLRLLEHLALFPCGLSMCFLQRGGFWVARLLKYLSSELPRCVSREREPSGRCTIFSNLASEVMQRQFHFIIFINSESVRPTRSRGGRQLNFSRSHQRISRYAFKPQGSSLLHTV